MSDTPKTRAERLAEMYARILRPVRATLLIVENPSGYETHRVLLSNGRVTVVRAHPKFFTPELAALTGRAC